MDRKAAVLSLGAALALLGAGCSANLLPDPESQAAALPAEAEVAVGATHDLLVAACQDKLTLVDIVMPAAVTTLFVGLGRLDALFYLPEAQLKALIPECEPVEYRVKSAAFDHASLELEATGNPNAFKVHARAAGEGTFTATVDVAGEELVVRSTMRAHVPNRVVFAPRCTVTTDETTEQLAGWLPADGWVEFSHRLYRDQLALSGYGLFAIEDPRLSFRESRGAVVSVKLPAQPGDLSLSSRFDPAFSLDLHLYDVTAIDALELTRSTSEELFVGQATYLSARATIGGKAPCVWGFPRTVTVETPAVCRFKGRADTHTLLLINNVELAIEGLAPGSCRVRIELPGTALSDVVELPVYRTFEEIPFPDALHPAIHLTDVWAASPDELFVVGWEDDVSGFLESVVLRYAGGTWGRMMKPSGAKTLWAVHGSRTDGAVFAVGGDGKVARPGGTTWQVTSTGVVEPLYDVWVFAANDVYAVGDKGTFLHFDGTSWSSIATGVTGRLTTLWGAAPNDVWIGGWGKVLLRYRNGALESALPPNPPATFDAINAISGPSLADVWMLDNDVVLRSSGGAWSQYPVPIVPGEVLRRLWAVGDGSAYAVVTRSSKVYVEWLGPSRRVAFPVEGGAALTGLGDELYLLTGKKLFRYTHDPAAFP